MTVCGVSRLGEQLQPHAGMPSHRSPRLRGSQVVVIAPQDLEVSMPADDRISRTSKPTTMENPSNDTAVGSLARMAGLQETAQTPSDHRTEGDTKDEDAPAPLATEDDCEPSSMKELRSETESAPGKDIQPCPALFAQPQDHPAADIEPVAAGPSNKHKTRLVICCDGGRDITLHKGLAQLGTKTGTIAHSISHIDHRTHYFQVVYYSNLGGAYPKTSRGKC